MKELTMASLFSGSGGFELAAMLSGIRPVWNSEIEPFPSRVTEKRFPFMKNYGDVSTISGKEVPPVDVITFGSPCFPEGTLILTDRGFKEIENVQKGDYVLTHKGRWRKVTATGFKTAETVILQSGYGNIECTANHPFLSKDNGAEEWIEAKEMAGRHLCIPVKIERPWEWEDYEPGKEIPPWIYSLSGGLRNSIFRNIERKNRETTVKDRKTALSIKFLAETLNSGTETAMERNGCDMADRFHHMYEVRTVEPTGCVKKVYNLTVDEDNSYTANGIAVHNCQDMSVAGKRKGLAAERSGLFYEAVRIIKEMRESTNGEKPRFIVWENVPGAFSSNKREDFRCVLEEICRIKDPGISVPECKKWKKAGNIVGDGFSVCWRTFDAQYWGVPQRRKRIYLVADFTGERASEILFESEGVSGYSQESFRAWQEAAGSIGKSTETSGIGIDGYNADVTDDTAATPGVNCGMSTGRNGAMILNDHGGERMDVTEDITATLRAEAHHPPVVLENHPADSRVKTKKEGNGKNMETDCENTPYLTAALARIEHLDNPEIWVNVINRQFIAPVFTVRTDRAPLIIENHPADSRVKINKDGIVQTLSTRMGTGGGNVPLLMESVKKESERSAVLKSAGFCTEHSAKSRGVGYEEETSPTLRAGTVPAAVTFVKGTRPKTKGGCPVWKEGKVANTLNTFDLGESRCNELVAEVFGICGVGSNAMKSDNPDSGIYKADTSRTIDTSGSNPSCNQGGMMVVALEGNGSRPSHHGTGYSEQDVSFTLNATEKHSVAYGLDRASFNQGRNAKYDFAVEKELEPPIVARGPGAVAVPCYSLSKNGFFTRVREEKTDTLSASQYKDPPVVNDRLTFSTSRNSLHTTNEKKSNTIHTLNATEQHAVAFADAHATLSANDGYKESSGQMTKNPKENFVSEVSYGIGRAAMNQSYNAKFSFQIEKEVEPTLMASGASGVAHPTFSTSKNSLHTIAEKEIAGTLSASDHKDPPVVNDRPTFGFYPQMKAEYIVRRLTPAECARLQGFPDWWCSGLESADPSEEETAEWKNKFETHKKAIGKTTKPKTDNQVRKWLRNPHSDSAEYKMWGNGIALPNAVFVLSGIRWLFDGGEK